ncbi:MAG: hypothetical protein FJW27_17505 [Acidimicrobiia bacterium]|nr:hypothetical protein [Acidimicrobiia bacterium]
MRLRARATCLALAVTLMACGGVADLFKQYEYEEETYLSLDGSATLSVNSSIPALNALRGSTFDPALDATLDRGAIAAFFSGPGVTVTRVTFSARNSRNYIHVRMNVDDVRKLHEIRPFNWSRYAFSQTNDLMLYVQHVGAATKGESGIRWQGDEIVAFRMHLPSKVPYHNAAANNLKRGNILVWEQSLADRVAGVPVEIDVRMETQSILYRTLVLFGVTLVVVGALFAGVIWWMQRSGRKGAAGRVSQGGRAQPGPVSPVDRVRAHVGTDQPRW